MYLRRLDLVGFKSFAPRTSTELLPGISVVVGPNGSGKCVTGDTRVTLSDGRDVPIAELVDAALGAASALELLDDGFVVRDNPLGLHVLSLDPDSLRLELRPILAFVKRTAPPRLLRLRTRDGRGLTVTPSHPLFSLQAGQLATVPAGEVRVGTYVALPRRLPTRGARVPLAPGALLGCFREDDNVFVPSSVPLRHWARAARARYATLAAWAAATGVAQTQLRGLLQGQSVNTAVLERLATHAADPPPVGDRLKSRGAGSIRVPAQMGPALARFLGLLIAEGVNRGTWQVRLVNSDPALAQDFASLASMLFGLRAHSRQSKPAEVDTFLSSATLSRVLDRCFGFRVDSTSANKVVPPHILEADPETQWAFLSGLFEGDAHLRPGQQDYVEYTTASPLLAQQVSGLLLRLDVFAIVRSKVAQATNAPRPQPRTYYSVLIYGTEQLRHVAQHLSFVGTKRAALEALRAAPERPTNPNRDLVPSATMLVRDASRLAALSIRGSRGGRPKLAAYVQQRCHASRAGLLAVAEQIDCVGRTPALAGAPLSALGRLATADVYWDQIASIEPIEPPDAWVYDLCVADTHNFVANNVIVHNSNVADAVRWVLGEQSAKAVRARKPEEVIFAGSARRQPLGMAEVSLVFDNSEGGLPIEYAEVRVTRRLYRSGDSEYLLNGARVRLRDITQLLLHAGISADGYAVIGQGSVDELILQRPDERRVAFENAADIRRHQLRLNDTRAKLAATTANLTRVQDVLAELAPHVRRLKTQADRAARAEAFRAELHELLRRWFGERLARAREEQRLAEAALQRAALGAQQAEAATRAAERSLEGFDSGLAALDVQLAELRPRVEQLRDQARAAERAVAVARERAAGLEVQQTGSAAERQRLEERLTRLVDEEAEAAGALQPAGAQAAESTGAHAADPPDARAPRGVSAHARGREGAGDAVAVEERALEPARQQAGQLERALMEAQRERARLAARRDQAEARAADAEAQLARAADSVRHFESSAAVEQARRADRASRIGALEQQLQALADERARSGQQLEQARAAVAETTDRRRASAAQVEQSTDALRAARQQRDRLQGALAALGLPEQEAPASLPAAFGPALDGLPVVGTLGELASRLRPLDRVLRGYLGRSIVLRDDAAAREAYRRLEATLPTDAPAWSVLSLDGAFLAPGGERGLESSDDGSATLADWRRQVATIESEVAAARTRGAELEASLQTARQRLEAADADERAARATLSQLDARLGQLDRGARQLRQDLQQLVADQERATRTAEHQAAARQDTHARVETLRSALTAARMERAAAAEALRAHDARLAELIAQVSAARAELAGLESAVLQRRAQHEARVALHARVLSELEATRTAEQAASARLDQLAAQRAELGARERELLAELEASRRALAPLEEQLLRAEQRRADVGAERRALDQRLGQLRADERAAHELREQHHVRAQRATDELERLHAEIAETAELEGEHALVEQLRLELPEAPREAAVDLEATRRRINVLQRELRAVGGVADSVVAEYREMRERHDFLEHQSADLRAAMAELETAAAELEGHMRERFEAVFRAVEAAFVECFRVLFGGGEARLVLTVPDDPLASGIDIVARPPGKKLQGLLSLSGGERALTIVALLFGLLKVNPTPFCVLDEVDAALDEANVQRFANLLADFAQRIQFIVVTHNRATMDKADALYGVSMDADGISRIFAVQPRSVATAAPPG